MPCLESAPASLAFRKASPKSISLAIAFSAIHHPSLTNAFNMSTTKQYSQVPTRDSLDDEPSKYTQAPPEYQATTSAAADEELLRGGPRRSEDNIPDDFKFGGVVAEATIDIRMQFVRKVYAIL